MSSLRLGVVLYQNSPEQLERLVRSMALCREEPGTPSFDVIWFDNSETDSARGVLAGLGEQAYRSSARNVGFGAGHNALMKDAFLAPGIDGYVCVNPDAILHPACLAELASERTRHESVGLVEARQIPEEHPKVYDPVSHATAWCVGCVLLVTRALYEVIGGFDEAMFLYCEDVDLSWRARAAGFGTYIAPAGLVHHYADGRPPERDPRAFMLASGAYLGRKYGAQLFEEECAREYERLRGRRPEGASPASLPPGAKTLADFAHGFSFAETRW